MNRPSGVGFKVPTKGDHVPQVACPEDQQLKEFLDGRMTPDPAADMERHVEACPRCLAVLERLIRPPGHWTTNLDALPSSTTADQEPSCQSLVNWICDLPRTASQRPATSHPTRRIETSCIGEYDILAELGAGGIGQVFRVRHRKTGTMGALKVLSSERRPRPETYDRFQREIRLLRELRHQNVVRAIDSGVWRGEPFVVMEFLDGIDLDRLVRTVGPLSVPDAMEVGRQIAVGLRYIHELKLVHRDVKPSNVILTADRVCLLDLGLARVVETDWDVTGPTLTGEALGTLRYAAPEQLGQAHAVDARADLYSLGGTLLWLLTGKPPFADAAPRDFWRLKLGTDDVRDSTLEQLAGTTDANVIGLLRRLLAPDPQDRPNTVSDVLRELECLSAGHRINEISRNHPARLADKAPVGPEQAISVVVTVLESEAGDSRRSSQVAILLGLFLTMAVLLISLVFRDPNGNNTTDGVASHDSTSDTTTTPARPLTSQAAISEVGWQGWPSGAPPAAISPFTAEQAGRHQASWAKFLDLPIEHSNSLGMTFRLIPPGEFLMGGTDDEVALTLKFTEATNDHAVRCLKSELPRHRVVLTQPFYLGRFEVTQSEFESVVGRNPSLFARTGTQPELAARVAGLDTSRHPVENISRSDAAEFCAKLSKREGLKPFYFRSGDNITDLDGTGYRLPTEAEWEFACRAGTLGSYWSGEQEADFLRVGWGGANSALRTHPVGELAPNPFGLCDTHGNVFEWVQDKWDPAFYSQFASREAVNPLCVTSDNRLCALRGGSWSPGAMFCRSSFRIAFDFSGQAQDFGFRVAVPIEAVRQALRTTPKNSAEPGSNP